MSTNLPSSVIRRQAVVYVRQSSAAQVTHHLESQRRQFELVDLARSYGFGQVDVIDDDLGRSASGAVDRPGFEHRQHTWISPGESALGAREPCRTGHWLCAWRAWSPTGGGICRPGDHGGSPSFQYTLGSAEAVGFSYRRSAENKSQFCRKGSERGGSQGLQFVF